MADSGVQEPSRGGIGRAFHQGPQFKPYLDTQDTALYESPASPESFSSGLSITRSLKSLFWI